MTGPFGRRTGLLALLAGLAACAAPEPPPPVVLPSEDPEPERVYSPGPIPWADLSEEHKRRARAGLARIGESADDDETLQARWMIMSPAQQRFLIRRPPPPPARPARPAARGRAAPARHPAHAPARPATTPPRRTPPPPRRPTTPQR
ncbi:hypothetical protein AAFN86_17200 [Roseomonas sp. CAU 1739]|uniref:hypothetical protein n=1 Tax=Roseomonas sp. CAU 1739 TaxID=3140364 RepID=UPI00325A8D9C